MISTERPQQPQIVVTWHEDRPGPVNAIHHINTFRPDDATITHSNAGATQSLHLDGDDFGFVVDAQRTIGRAGILDIDAGTHTSMIGYADARSEQGAEFQALEQAIVAAAKLGRGDGGSGIDARPGDIRFMVRGIDGLDTSARWTLANAPAEVLEVQRLAAQVASRYDGQVNTDDSYGTIFTA